MILIRKNSTLLLGCFAGTSKNCILLPLSNFLTHISLFASKADHPSPKTSFIVKYLIDSVGLSSSEAAKCSKFITHIKSPSKPDSVLEFFRKNGFTDAAIKRIICSHSRVLCAKVDSTLKPRFETLREIGFSDTQITKLITTNPLTLNHLSNCNVLSRIEFLKSIIGSSDGLVRAISHDTSFLSSSLEKIIKPNINFLRECQISNERIGSLLINNQKLIGRSPNSLKSITKRVRELGVLPGSGMFYHAFRSLCRINSDTVDAKIKLLGSLGFSESELLSAIFKQPPILCLSAKNLCETVDFLVKEVGCTPSYVSKRPSILGLSLTKRLIPRHYIMQLIVEKGLLKKKIDFYRFVSISEGRFLEKYIFSVQERMPEVLDVYSAASAGKFLY